jgi:hypothetical protein
METSRKNMQLLLILLQKTEQQKDFSTLSVVIFQYHTDN